jgi:hypothetical protein
MAEQIPALIARLRSGVNIAAADAAQQLLYEHWVAQEQWPLSPIALALLVGVAPDLWAAHVATLGLTAEAEQLHARLVADLAREGEQHINGLRLRAWAQSQGVALPAAAEHLLDFVARTLPRLATELPATGAPGSGSRDREMVLGAALALVTRFTEDCLDEQRMFDGARIARLMLTQAALWFPDGMPRMDEQAIAQLVEHYISGF